MKDGRQWCELISMIDMVDMVLVACDEQLAFLGPDTSILIAIVVVSKKM